jgi:hypothetical protein
MKLVEDQKNLRRKSGANEQKDSVAQNVTTQVIDSAGSFGAGCRNRTRDLLITNQLLYQLS